MNILRKMLSALKEVKLYILIPSIILATGSTIGSTILMTQGAEEYRILSYFMLGVMIVTLSYSVYGVIHIYPRTKQTILKWSENHPYWNKKFTTYGFGTLALTACSLLVTLTFAVYNGSVAIVIGSVWFGALAAYYLVLIILRSSALFYVGKRRRAIDRGQSEKTTQINDARQYLICGVMLFLLPLCMSFGILQMVVAGESFVHTGITIYVYAIYAFIKIITAVYSAVKERRTPSLIISEIKNIKLADAMVSILALQTAMFKEFQGEFEDNLVKIMNGATGAVVCALTVALGIFMIVNAKIKLKAVNKGQNEKN